MKNCHYVGSHLRILSTGKSNKNSNKQCYLSLLLPITTAPACDQSATRLPTLSFSLFLQLPHFVTGDKIFVSICFCMIFCCCMLYYCSRGCSFACRWCCGCRCYRCWCIAYVMTYWKYKCNIAPTATMPTLLLLLASRKNLSEVPKQFF